jgi:hypothetical protein
VLPIYRVVEEDYQSTHCCILENCNLHQQSSVNLDHVLDAMITRK